MRVLILQGSSRIDGNTAIVASLMADQMKADLIHLANLNIGHYDYEYRNSNDDFLPLIKRMVSDYDLFVFATPVYWYSMSGRMKVFFDRLSDCIRIEKETGRKLRGKSMAVISNSGDSTLYPELFKAFELSAEYLGMNYLGHIHTWVKENQLPESVNRSIRNFSSELSK